MPANAPVVKIAAKQTRAIDEKNSSILTWRWWPLIFGALACIAMLLHFGVSARDLAAYSTYLLLAITLPGVLLWRATHGPSRTVLDDTIAGSTLGLILSLFAYVLTRAAGIPSYSLLIPAGVLLAFAFIPALRRHWRVHHAEQVPRWFAWGITALVLLCLAWIAWRAFTTHPFDGPAANLPYLDIPYHLALAGELKNHVPPDVPYLAGEPLSYHWFAHAHLAASSWGTGIDLEVLLLRLWIVPLVAITVVGTALLAVRISKRWWAGLAAIVIGFLATVFSPFRFSDKPIVFETRALDDWWWQSPSQAFGAALFTGCALLTVTLLREQRPSTSTWVLFVSFLVALAGSKGTFLPVLCAGLSTVVVVHWLTHRRWHRSALIAAAGTGLVLAMAMLVVYRGQSDGMRVRPLHNMGRMPGVIESHLGLPWLPTRPWVLLTIGVLTLVIWFLRASGAVGLLNRTQLRDPTITWLLGVVLAGICATVVFAHTGFSEYYFLRSVAPLVGVASACGLAALVAPLKETEPRKFRIATLLFGATGIGFVIAAGLYWLSPEQPTFADVTGRGATLWALTWPYLALLGIVLTLGVVLVPLGMNRLTAAALASVLIGTGTFGLVREWGGIARELLDNGTTAHALPSNATPFPAGARTATRWLRDHSNPNDIVATNAHCRSRDGQGRCDNRAFWISGYSERRILIEGWGYTERTGSNSQTTPFMYQPYWSPEKLAANDAVFSAPNADTVHVLRDEYHVRWLFVDKRERVNFSELEKAAKLRYQSGECAIFELL